MVIQNMLHTHEGKISFRRKKPRFVTVLHLIKYLKQVKYQRLLNTCAPISELPSDTSTMFQAVEETAPPPL